MTAAPEFTNRAFVLAVPRDDPPSTSKKSPGGGDGNRSDVAEEPGGINAPAGLLHSLQTVSDYGGCQISYMYIACTIPAVINCCLF